MNESAESEGTDSMKAGSTLAAGAAAVPYRSDTIRKDLPGGLVLLVKTDGTVSYETAEGEIHNVIEGVTPPAPPEPEPPKPVPGKIVIGDDAVSRFVPDDGSDPLDLTAAINARDEEAKLSQSDRKLRELEKALMKARDEVENAKTVEEKNAILDRTVGEMYQRAVNWYNVALSREVAMRALAPLIAPAQLANGLPDVQVTPSQ